MDKQKRVLAVHDISCVGKCSLTVALPIISASGSECSVLPTSILSTHTGGFDGYTFCDLTGEIEPITKHWKELALPVDYIYTGYLGSFEQLKLIGKLFKDFRNPSTKICIDPVMADNGKLYTLFDESFARGMADLCRQADIIMPNITEASFMTGVPYKEQYDKSYIEEMMAALNKLGPETIILTGVSFRDDQLGAACYQNGSISYFMENRIDGYFHGTGDVFGSALVGALARGITPEKAMEIAVCYTVASIKKTKELNTEARYGVCFETEIPKYIKMLGE